MESLDTITEERARDIIWDYLKKEYPSNNLRMLASRILKGVHITEWPEAGFLADYWRERGKG